MKPNPYKSDSHDMYRRCCSPHNVPTGAPAWEDHYGRAVLYSYWHQGALYVGNEEYGNRVNFCPFCGRAAEDKFEFVS